MFKVKGSYKSQKSWRPSQTSAGHSGRYPSEKACFPGRKSVLTSMCMHAYLFHNKICNIYYIVSFKMLHACIWLGIYVWIYMHTCIHKYVCRSTCVAITYMHIYVYMCVFIFLSISLSPLIVFPFILLSFSSCFFSIFHQLNTKCSLFI